LKKKLDFVFGLTFCQPEALHLLGPYKSVAMFMWRPLGNSSFTSKRQPQGVGGRLLRHYFSKFCLRIKEGGGGKLILYEERGRINYLCTCMLFTWRGT